MSMHGTVPHSFYLSVRAKSRTGLGMRAHSYAELRVVNALGQLVQEQNLPLNNRIVELNVKGVASGLLACSLYVDGRFLSSAVLNVIK